MPCILPERSKHHLFNLSIHTHYRIVSCHCSTIPIRTAQSGWKVKPSQKEEREEVTSGAPTSPPVMIPNTSQSAPRDRPIGKASKQHKHVPKRRTGEKKVTPKIIERIQHPRSLLLLPTSRLSTARNGQFDCRHGSRAQLVWESAIRLSRPSLNRRAHTYLPRYLNSRHRLIPIAPQP